MREAALWWSSMTYNLCLQLIIFYFVFSSLMMQLIMKNFMTWLLLWYTVAGMQLLTI